VTTLQTILQLVSSILTSIGILTANPAFGIAGSVAKLVPLLGTLSVLAAEGEGAYDRLVELDKQLKAIVATGLAPTDADWQGWIARHEAAKARLQA